MRQALVGSPLFTASLYVLDPRFALFANLMSHGTTSPFDCQASLVFGRQRTAEGGKGTDVRPAGRVHPREAASEQKQGEIDGKRSAISVSDQRLTIAVRHDRRWWGRGQRRSPGCVECGAKSKVRENVSEVRYRDF
jgi:hypothetical protein